MLCNTVGIMVFIFIFTVLAAGDAIDRQYLPHEHPPKTTDNVLLVCHNDRLMKLDNKDIVDKLKAALKSSDSSANSIDGVHTEDEFFKKTVHFYGSGLGIECVPEDNAGDDIIQLTQPDSVFGSVLHENNPNKVYFYFAVYPDSVAVFKAARNAAVAAGYEVGWTSIKQNEPLILGGRDGQGPNVQ
jgi:hypothetical protein